MSKDRIGEIIHFLKLRGFWFSHIRNFEGRMKLMAQYIQLGTLVALAFGTGYGVYANGLKDSLKGQLVFFPISLVTGGHNVMCYLYQSRLMSTIKSLKTCIRSHAEFWEIEIQEKYFDRVWKLIARYTTLTFVSSFIYFIFPKVLQILLYTFNIVTVTAPKFPMPFSPVEDYFIETFNLIWAAAVVNSHLGFVGLYSIIVTSAYSEMVIFQKLLSTIEYNQYENKVAFITSRHTNILRLNNEVKELLGLPCAFQSSLLSLNVCICLYVVITTTDAGVMVMYSYGILFYVTTGFFYCGLGELFQSEGDSIFKSLCEKRWHELSPDNRKYFNMMLRQAKKTQRIEYKGRTPMNFGSYAKFINSSYTYFMLMQSVTK